MAEEEPSLLRLSVVYSGDLAPCNAVIDLTISTVYVGPLVYHELAISKDLRHALAVIASEAANNGCNLVKTTLSHDGTGLGSPHTFTNTECVVTKESTMAESAAISILKKQKAKAAEPDADAEEAVATTGSEDVDADAGEEVPADDVAEPVAESSKPAAAKAATATKNKVTPAILDEIQGAATEIENLTEASAIKALHDMVENQSFDEFRKGGLLAKIQTENWIGEHPNFKAFVEAEFDIKYRTAMYWISIYNSLVSSQVPWSKVKRLGWTKLKELAPIITLDNVDDVLKAVSGMNVAQVIAYVEEFAKTGDATSVPADTSDIKSKTFKLFPAQKETVDIAVEKAKKVSGTDSDGMALEYICSDYLSGGASTMAKAKTKASPGDSDSPSLPMPKDGDELMPYLESVKNAYEDEQESLTAILSAVAGLFPNAQINVELASD